MESQNHRITEAVLGVVSCHRGTDISQDPQFYDVKQQLRSAVGAVVGPDAVLLIEIAHKDRVRVNDLVVPTSSGSTA